MNNPTNRSSVYQEVSVQTSSPVRLVIMLYEGAIRFLRQSIEAIQVRDLEQKRQYIDRSIAIIQHMQSTLDCDKGLEIAADLDRLYTYITSCILAGSGKLDTAPLEEAIKLLSVLLTGWEQVAKKEQLPSVLPVLLAQQAAGGRLEWNG